MASIFVFLIILAIATSPRGNSIELNSKNEWKFAKETYFIDGKKQNIEVSNEEIAYSMELKTMGNVYTFEFSNDNGNDSFACSIKYLMSHQINYAINFMNDRISYDLTLFLPNQQTVTLEMVNYTTSFAIEIPCESLTLTIQTINHEFLFGIKVDI